MKRLTFCLALAAVLLAGCKHQSKEFSTHNFNGEYYFNYIFDEPFVFDLDTVGIKYSYSLEWPDEGMVSKAAERELQFLCFGDSLAATLNEAAQNWMGQVVFYENGRQETTQPFDEDGEYSYVSLEGTWLVGDRLATCVVYSEYYPLGAAHGLYSNDYLTIDRKTGDVIHLTDIVADTNLLCEAVANAINDLDENGDVLECLFSEYRDTNRMPLPENFVIDSDINAITVMYGIYGIAPYACGIQEVFLPISWLSERVPLTPYAKKLFNL